MLCDKILSHIRILYVPQSRIILSLIKYDVVIITLHLKMINRLNGEKKRKIEYKPY